MFYFIAKSNCYITVYADDTNLLVKGKTYEKVYHTIGFACSCFYKSLGMDLP